MKKIHVLLLIALVLATSMVGSRAYSQAGNVVIVQGDITTDTTWSRSNIYVLRGAVFVRQGAQGLDVGTDTGGGFCVYEGKQ